MQSFRIFHPFHGPSDLLTHIEEVHGVTAANSVSEVLTRATAAGVPWLKIIMALAPYILTALSGGTLDIGALIQAILVLINSPSAISSAA